MARQLQVLLHLIIVSLLGGGCASPHQARRTINAHGELALPAAAVIGVSHHRVAPGFTLGTPASRREAMAQISEDIGTNDPFAVVALPAVYAFRAVSAGTLGALMGAPGEDIGPAQRQIEIAVRELAFPGRINAHLARRLAPASVRPLAHGVPVEPRQAHGRIRLGDSSNLVWAADAPEPHPLQGTEIDIVLSIRGLHQGFRAATPTRREISNGVVNDFNPPLMLVLAVELSAARVADWSPLGHVSLRYESGPHRFTTWGAGEARLLRQELAAAWAHFESELSNRIVHR